MEITLGKELCPLKATKNSPDETVVTAVYDKWQAWNKQALTEITLMLTDIPLNAVLLFPYTSQVWEDLEHHYEGKGNQLALNLFKEVFKDNFVEIISMEEQVISLQQKLQKLKDLGYEVNNNLVGIAIMSGLPELYFSLKQHLSMQDESRLTTGFIIKQVLLEEKNHIRPLSQIAFVVKTLNH